MLKMVCTMKAWALSKISSTTLKNLTNVYIELYDSEKKIRPKANSMPMPTLRRRKATTLAIKTAQQNTLQRFQSF